MSQGRSLFRPVQAWHDETFLLVPKPSEEPAPPAAEATDSFESFPRGHPAAAAGRQTLLVTRQRRSAVDC